MGVTVLVRNWLGVIAQVAAIACPPYNVAGFCKAFATANANRLRIDPCEKKTKRNEFARWREGVPPGLPAGRYHYHGVSIAYLLIRKNLDEVLKKIGFCVGDAS